MIVNHHSTLFFIELKFEDIIVSNVQNYIV